MFSFLTSKPLLLALLVSLSLNGLFGYLSYHFYGATAQAVASLDIALEDNKSLEKSYEKQEMTCKIADSIASEFQSDKKEIDKETEVTLEKLNSLAAKKAPIAINKAAEVKDEEIGVASLDDKLGDDVVGLLQSHYDSLQR